VIVCRVHGLTLLSQIAKKKRLLRQSEEAKALSKKNQATTIATTATKIDDQDLLSIQAVHQSDSESEESLSGDDRDETDDPIPISEAALQNIIIEDVLPVEKELPVFEIELKLEKTIPGNEERESEEPPSRDFLIDRNDKQDRIDETLLLSNMRTQTIDDHEINTDKSSAALSTLRKLKSKKVSHLIEHPISLMIFSQLMTQTSQLEFPQIDIEPTTEVPLANGEITPQPPSPDIESSETDSHPTLTTCSSSQLFDQYFVPLSSTIITSKNENDQILYTCAKGPDDLPGLKAWTLVYYLPSLPRHLPS
jgi:hypothetical protein